MTKKCKKLGLGRKAQIWKAGENTNNLRAQKRKMGGKNRKQYEYRYDNMMAQKACVSEKGNCGFH